MQGGILPLSNACDWPPSRTPPEQSPGRVDGRVTSQPLWCGRVTSGTDATQTRLGGRAASGNLVSNDIPVTLNQGCNFWNLIGGTERGKDAQGSTIKILLDTDFTSDLAHFLHNIVGAQLNIGGAQALPKRYKVTPCLKLAFPVTTNADYQSRRCCRYCVASSFTLPLPRR